MVTDLFETVSPELAISTKTRRTGRSPTSTKHFLSAAPLSTDTPTLPTAFSLLWLRVGLFMLRATEDMTMLAVRRCSFPALGERLVGLGAERVVC